MRRARAERRFAARERRCAEALARLPAAEAVAEGPGGPSPSLLLDLGDLGIAMGLLDWPGFPIVFPES